MTYKQDRLFIICLHPRDFEHKLHPVTGKGMGITSAFTIQQPHPVVSTQQVSSAIFHLTLGGGKMIAIISIIPSNTMQKLWLSMTIPMIEDGYSTW